MGYWSERQIEEGELLVSFGGGGYVCDECVGDEALKEFVRGHADSTQCSYCDRDEQQPIAADSDDVLRHIGQALARYYASPDDVLYYDDESESGYAGPDLDDVEDLITEEELGRYEFAQFVYRAFSDSRWVAWEPYADPEHEVLRLSWEQFSKTIKHETRFLFALSSPAHDSYPDPGVPVRRGVEILDEIGRLVREFDLTRVLHPDVPLYRVRVCKPEQHVTGARDIGPPPVAHAMQNRMSPAGISMAYCALDPETAIAETLQCPAGPDRIVWTGRFAVDEPTVIVDLGLLPDIPSFFDLSESVAHREQLTFLHQFRADVSKSIERDDHIHVEYVPTQVITEYLRRAFLTADDKPAFGLQFSSSRRPEGQNVVLFLDQEGCIDAGGNAAEQPALRLHDLDSRPAADICAEVG